jgi:hypothetical protein
MVYLVISIGVEFLKSGIYIFPDSRVSTFLFRASRLAFPTFILLWQYFVASTIANPKLARWYAIAQVV